MVHIKEIYRNKNLVGFDVSGHAGYAGYGNDIVCAAVSTLTINAINTLNEVVHCETTEKSYECGHITFEVSDNVSVFAELVLKSTRLGFSSIKESYSQYIDYQKGENAMSPGEE